MAKGPVGFGPKSGIDNKDYVLYSAPVEDITGRPENLFGHSVGAPSADLTDVVTYSTVEMRGGKVMQVSRMKRAAQETSRTLTIGIPSVLWSPVMERSFNGCSNTFFLIYLCPEDEIYNHFDIAADGFLTPAVPAEDLIAIDDTTIITHTSDLQVTSMPRGWALGFRPIYAIASTALNDVTFLTRECAGCNSLYGYELAIVGGDGTAAASVLSSENRLSTTTSHTLTGASDGDVAKAVFNDGDVILVAAYTSATDFASATEAAVYRSGDRGTSFAAVSGLDDAFVGFLHAGDAIFAYGNTIAGDAVIFFSLDQGVSWTEVTSDALPTSDSLVDGAYDEETGFVYFVSSGAVLLKGRLSGESFSVSDISSNLVGSPSGLGAVAVLHKNIVLVGGASGYLAQSNDGGVTFVAKAISTTDAISAIDGNAWRTIVAAGTALFERSALTKNAFSAIVLRDGGSVTGDYTAVRMAPDDDFNRFVAVTDDGEVVFGAPFYPNA
jgi:hypothetical protein